MKKTALLICTLSIYLLAQTEIKKVITSNYNLYNTQIIKFQSEFVDDSFHIFVSLPDSYNKSSIAYPVLYLLDADVSYGMAASIARYLQFGGDIPELIIIGIGYGAIQESDGNMRNRDYSPSKRKNKPDTGGASEFLEFLTAELIPFVDSTYRTIPADRTINGYSLGGLFTLYTLFNSPKTFNRYIIGSPYLPWGNFTIFDIEESAAIKHTEINANVYISVGSEESEQKYFNPIDEIVTIIQERNYKGLKIETKVFDGGTHLMCPPEALTYGLVSVFKK
jgi:predicted alpha/beta superfamily hydrolase